jgi:transcriptional antiterminator RfaH
MLAVRRRDRVIWSLWHSVEIPLFSGYLFVRLSYRENWAPIQSTQGVARLIVASGRPAVLPAGLVEALQAGDDARRSIAPLDASWPPGTACTLAAGPMRGHDAVVIGTRDGRVLVGVMCFGAMREVAVAADCLMARA